MSETARKLVDEMVAAGEWPKPELLEAIVAQGADAIEPLREVVRRDLHGWPEEAPIDNAVNLLGVLRAEQALPDLLTLFRRYDGEMLEMLPGVLAQFGEAVIEPALALVLDNSLSWSVRSFAAEAVIEAAGSDLALRERVAAALRELLADLLARAGDFVGPNQEQTGPEAEDEHELPGEELGEDEEGPLDEEAVEPGEEEDWDEEDFDEEDWDDADEGLDEPGPPEPPSPAENYVPLVTTLVGDLATMADPQSRPAIEAAFDAQVVDPFMIRREDVAAYYREGPKPSRPRFEPDRWLREYRESYEAHEEREREQARTQSLQYAPTPPAAAEEEYEPAPRLAPIENTGRKIGRNDPCWCGSGKKYKKCHLGKDQESGT